MACGDRGVNNLRGKIGKNNLHNKWLSLGRERNIQQERRVIF